MAYWSSKIIIVPVLGLLGWCISRATAGCDPESPIVGPMPEFTDHFRAVFDLLEEQTPLQVGKKGGRFEAWSPPDGQLGAIVALATCYTIHPSFCKTCIKDVAIFLSKCRSGAGFFGIGLYCDVQFWTVR